jgi:hypothetical protein
MLLSAQPVTNDQGRYALAEKIILDLLKERQDLLEAKDIELKERQDLLEAKEIERKELSMKNDILLVMSTQQLDKIQTLEKRLHPVINYKGMRKTLQWLQQGLRSNSLHACANILESKKERMDLYTKWASNTLGPAPRMEK